MLNNAFKKNMAWLESEQAAAPHGYYRQAQVLVSRESLDKSKAFMNMKAHASQERGANNRKYNLVSCT